MKKITTLLFILSAAFVYSQSNKQGKSVYSLIGQDYAKLGKEIVFDDYSIKNIGGYLLPKDDFDTDYGVVNYQSFDKHFLLFFKTDNSKQIITDILEISKKDFQDKILTEFCVTKNGLQSDIIAVVKNTDSEFYTKIFKAWKTNRKTGKFEKINKRKIKKCINEGYGV